MSLVDVPRHLMLLVLVLLLPVPAHLQAPVMPAQAAARSPASLQLLGNADFAAAGGAGGGAAQWLPEGRGYTVVPTVRHGAVGGSIRSNATATAQTAGAVQVFAAPAGGAGRLLRVRGWSSAAAVSGVQDDDYAISCDLAFADGSQRYGVAIARFPAGTHSWVQAAADYRLPAAPAPALRTISFYLLFRGNHTGSAAFSDVGCWLDEGPAPPPTPPPPSVAQRWAIYSAYGEGTWTDPSCPGGCPETNAFGVSAKYTNVFFSPFLNLVTDDPVLCPADFDPATDGHRGHKCMPDPALFAKGAAAVPVGRRAIWLASNPSALYAINRPRSSVNGSCTRDGACSPATTICFGHGPNATCSYYRDEIGTAGFVGPWSEAWQRLSAARFDWWMGEYKAAGATLDWLYMDDEDRPGPDDMSWDYVAHQRNSSGQQGAGAAIMADPRWPALRQQLAAFAHEAGCPWLGGLADWEGWQPTDCRTLCWNEVAQNLSAAAIGAAVYEPTRKHFPECKGANFAHVSATVMRVPAFPCVRICRSLRS